MRLYILLIASLNVVYSQTNRPSAQIDADISEFNLEGQVKVITNNISYEAAGIEQKYFDFYKKFGQTYGFELGSLNTSASTNIYTKVMRDICRLISSLRYIDGVDYRTKVSRTVNIFKQQYYISILNDIDELKSAVNKKPVAIKCWNKSKPQIANGVNSFLEKIQGEITTVFKELEPKVDDSLTGMQVEIEKIADEVEAAGTDDFDLTIYFRSNYRKIVSKFADHRDDIASILNSTWINTIGNVNSTLIAAMGDYQKAKVSVLNCVQSA